MNCSIGSSIGFGKLPGLSVGLSCHSRQLKERITLDPSQSKMTATRLKECQKVALPSGYEDMRKGW